MTIRNGVFLAALVWPSLALAQGASRLPAPASRAEFARSLEAKDAVARAGAYETSVAILTGELHRPDITPEDMAQDLVNVAVLSNVSNARIHAVTALLQSGKRDKPRPYPGALRQLVEVYRRATNVGIKGVALDGIVQIASPDTALQILKPLAETRDPGFPAQQLAAINLIAQLNTSASVAYLRDLDRRNAIAERWALDALKRHAAAGYRAPREGSPPGA